MEVFHVDRACTLRRGQEIRLVPTRPGKLLRGAQMSVGLPPEAHAHLHDLFPEGISSHGIQHLYSRDGMEWMLEAARWQHAPDQPSRLQSWFAFRSLEAAKDWARSANRCGTCRIWRIEAHRYQLRDMRLCHGRPDALGAVRAKQYWTELPTDAEVEVVMQAPFDVIECVAESRHSPAGS